MPFFERDAGSQVLLAERAGYLVAEVHADQVFDTLVRILPSRHEPQRTAGACPETQPGPPRSYLRPVSNFFLNSRTAIAGRTSARFDT